MPKPETLREDRRPPGPLCHPPRQTAPTVWHVAVLLLATAGGGCVRPGYRVFWSPPQPLAESVGGPALMWWGTTDGQANTVVLAGGENLAPGPMAGQITTAVRPLVLPGQVAGTTPPVTDTAPSQIGTWPLLPRRLAYAGTVTDGPDLIMVGGHDGTLAAADVNRLTRHDGQPVWVPLPALPSPRIQPAVTILGSELHVLGGADSVEAPLAETTDHYRFDLARPTQGWVSLGAVPGPARRAMGVASVAGRLVVFGGVARDADGQAMVFAHAYRYSQLRDEWERLADLPRPLYSPAVVALDSRYVLIAGGGTAAGLTEPNAGPSRSSQAPPTRPDSPLAVQPLAPPNPGDRYSREVYLYDTISDLYWPMPDLPTPMLADALTGRDGRLVILGRTEPVTPGGPPQSVWQLAEFALRGYRRGR